MVTDVGPASVGHQTTADQVVRPRRLDHAEQGAEERAGRGIHATDHAVSPAVLHHHGRVVVGVEQQLAGIGKPELLVAVERLEKAAKIRQIGGLFGIDHAQMVERDLLASRDFFNHGTTSEQNGHTKAEFIEMTPGGNGTRIFALGENNAFGMTAQPAENGFDELHSLSQPAAWRT